jgi:hypothetical protein
MALANDIAAVFGLDRSGPAPAGVGIKQRTNPTIIAADITRTRFMTISLRAIRALSTDGSFCKRRYKSKIILYQQTRKRNTRISHVENGIFYRQPNFTGP